MEELREKTNHADLMDKIYGFQRHFYDVTRRFFLLGRNRLLSRMDIKPGQKVLEVGCGTARNLIKLARRHPGASCFGVDISSQMLTTARQKIGPDISECITLKNAPAEDVGHKETFGSAEPFDHIFFSYSLTMIPNWRDALDTAYSNLKPGGRIYIVDFWDQKQLPVVFGKLLRWWLRLFHVKYEPELIPYLNSWQDENRVRLEMESVMRSFSILIIVRDIVKQP